MPRPSGKHTGVLGRIPADARAETNGRNEVWVAGDEQGVELDEQGNEETKTLAVKMSLSSHFLSIHGPPFLSFFCAGFADEAPPCLSAHRSLDSIVSYVQCFPNPAYIWGEGGALMYI